MHAARKVALTSTALLAVASTAVAGCESGSATAVPTTGSAPGCPTVLANAKQAVSTAEYVNTPWTGPTTGPQAVPGKSIVYVAQTMTNPGAAGAADGAQEAAKVIGWKLRIIDGHGTPAGIQAAFSQAIDLKPSGIVIG